VGRCVLWAGVSYGPVCLMGRCVLWASASYGPMRLMGQCVLWAGASYGPVCLMGQCVLWAGVSYGPVCLMGRCVLWAGKYSNYINTKSLFNDNFINVLHCLVKELGKKTHFDGTEGTGDAIDTSLVCTVSTLSIFGICII